MKIDYKRIGKRIADRRRELSLKQSEVEEKTEIGFKYLSNIERGISVPSLEVILRISEALETTPDALLCGAYRSDGNERERAIALIRGLPESDLPLVTSFLSWLTAKE